jgi:hypothetical protein
MCVGMFQKTKTKTKQNKTKYKKQKTKRLGLPTSIVMYHSNIGV